MERSRLVKNLTPYLLLFSALFAQTAVADGTDSRQLKQQEQRYAICAALAETQQRQQFTQKLLTLHQQNNPSVPTDDRQKWVRQKIATFERSYHEYSPQSKQKLFGKICLTENLQTDENFKGLQVSELPESLQSKIHIIATCALISNSYGLKQQAQKLTAANTLIIIAGGMNGKNQALQQLARIHQEVTNELKSLDKTQLKNQFTTSCNQVKKMQNTQ
ncbi:hypothetical protein [Thiomicrorhabdus sp. 6S3-12]|uniref:hypothetical protein n=1 Tax=Thiomicrorhabdus sp. 6S3-12 TaxID=2819681 RepID=UPI001AADCB4C|nr:hypothetical protein [Thiomicrorhabdus sp. 6S3-12]MBO1923926.1 hypothetical protein [Thiomicrorhabdus sp. 6S3-12]